MDLAHDSHVAPVAGIAWGVPVVLLVVLVGAYLTGVARWQRQGRAWSGRRTAAFVAGVAAMSLSLSPVVEAVALGDARGHMLQHLLLGMYAPLGLVLGAPVTLLLGSLPLSRRHVVVSVARVLRHPVLHALVHPVTAGVISTAGLYVLYLTPLLAVSERSSPVHILVHVHVVAAGCLLTWSLVGPDPAPRRPGVRTRVVVLVLTGGAHAYLAKLLYARAGELPPGTDHPVGEAQQAAQLMYYGGDVAEILLAVALFAWWLHHRRPGAPRTAPPSLGRQAPGRAVAAATTTGSVHPRAKPAMRRSMSRWRTREPMRSATGANQRGLHAKL